MKNPILQSPEIIDRFDKLPPDSKRALKEFCGWLYGHAKGKAEHSWQQSKAPMAVYWKAVAAWSYHIKRSIKVDPTPEIPEQLTGLFQELVEAGYQKGYPLQQSFFDEQMASQPCADCLSQVRTFPYHRMENGKLTGYRIFAVCINDHVNEY